MRKRRKGNVTDAKERTEEFSKRYQELCKELGLQIAFSPQWVQSMDTGDYRLKIVLSLVPLPKAEGELQR